MVLEEVEALQLFNFIISLSSGRQDLNLRPPAPKAILFGTTKQKVYYFQYLTKEEPRRTPSRSLIFCNLKSKIQPISQPFSQPVSLFFTLCRVLGFNHRAANFREIKYRSFLFSMSQFFSIFSDEIPIRRDKYRRIL